MTMKTKILPILLILTIIFAFSCENTPDDPIPDEPVEIKLTQKSKALLNASNAFAFDIFCEVLEAEEADKNSMISPLSISLALAMTYNGAETETKTEMEEALRLSGLSREEINKSFRELIDALLSVDPKVTTEIANSIWANNGFPFYEEFMETNRYYYDAEVKNKDFSNPATKDEINGWIADKTHDKITDVLDRIPADAVMYLINAIYFKGQWKYQFDEDDTRPEMFYDEEGNNIAESDMMNLREEIWYSHTDNYKAVDLHYGQGNYSMLIMLPAYESSVDELAASLNQNKWDALIDGMEKTDMNVYIPRFKFEYKNLLNDELKAMGMTKAFEPGIADFTGMSELGRLLYISRVIHQSFVEVNEEGTEAAAATVVEVGFTSAGPGEVPIPTFRANRPFLFAIKERSTGAIMFMGKVMDPTAE